MKKDIHPDYKPVIFHDVTCNKSFLLSSTVKTTETMKYEDGKVYIGEFRDDKREGRGLLKQRQGPQERKLYCGTFRDDSLMLDKHAQLW